MIQVDGLTMAYHGIPLFRQATFNVQPGERCGLVGRNGSGKSTLFRILTGIESEDGGTISIRKGYSIGMLDQHIRFTKDTILEEAALGLRGADANSLYKAEMILFGLGFVEEDMEKSPADLSGGYQLRLHLAKVLISEPDCLLLDEPTNYLDIVSIRWFTRFLQQWKGEFILISHDREFMDSVTTHTMGIHRQKVNKIQGDTVAYVEQLLQEEEIHERTRQNIEKKRAHLQSFIDRFGAKASKAAQAQSRQKMLQRIPSLEKLKDIYNLDFHFNEASFPGHKMLEATELCFSYDPQADQNLIDHLSLTIENGDRVAIVGKNGRGKSTILRLLTEELKAQSGKIACSERLRIGYFGQTNIDRLHPKHTVEEEVSIANPSLSRTEVKGICGLMMFSGDRAEKPVSVLSGGERSRVLLGKILATPCNLLLLDEPTHHLDMESIEALIDALEDFQGAVIIVTHSELILKRLALDKIVVCTRNQQKLFLGGYEEFLEKDGWHEEGDGGKPKKKGAEVVDRKQRRAELINERTKAVKPHDQEIQKRETKLAQLEKEQQEASEALAVASGSAELAKTIAVRQRQIDRLYQELESLVVKRDACYEELSRQIDAL